MFCFKLSLVIVFINLILHIFNKYFFLLKKKFFLVRCMFHFLLAIRDQNNNIEHIWNTKAVSRVLSQSLCRSDREQLNVCLWRLQVNCAYGNRRRKHQRDYRTLNAEDYIFRALFLRDVNEAKDLKAFCNKLVEGLKSLFRQVTRRGWARMVS